MQLLGRGQLKLFMLQKMEADMGDVTDILNILCFYTKRAFSSLFRLSFPTQLNVIFKPWRNFANFKSCRRFIIAYSYFGCIFCIAYSLKLKEN